MKKAKTIIGVVVIFVIGALCGALGDHIVGKIRFEKYVNGDRKYYENLVVGSLNKELKLDASQREKIRQIVKETFSETHAVYMQYRPQMQSILEKKRLETRAILRPDQIEPYEKLIAREKAKAEKKRKQWAETD